MSDLSSIIKLFKLLRHVSMIGIYAYFAGAPESNQVVDNLFGDLSFCRVYAPFMEFQEVTSTIFFNQVALVLLDKDESLLRDYLSSLWDLLFPL